MTGAAVPGAEAGGLGALFEPAGSDWRPTDLAAGPWSRDACHGGPVAALMVRALERVPALVPMRLTRMTLELVRPVPLAPLRLDAWARPGPKRVGLVEAELGIAGTDTVVAIARASRVRVTATPVHLPDGAVESPPVRPERADELPPVARVAFHSHAVEHRFTAGRFDAPGPATDWCRLRVPVVPGETPTGWQRAVAVADFGNGISSLARWDRWLFINPDLTVHLWREPVGEWVCADAVTRTAPDGIGLAETVLWDSSGRVGRGCQSLLIDHR